MSIDMGKAKLYDSLSAEPSIGMLTLHSNNLYFDGEKSDGTPRRFRVNINDLISLESENEYSGRILFPHPHREGREILIVFENDTLYKSIRLQRRNYPTGFINKIVRNIEDLSFNRKIAFGLIIGLIVLALYYYSVNHVYILVPEQSDQQIGYYGYESVLENYETCDNRTLNNTITELIHTVTSEKSSFQYEFTIVDHPVPNAFAFPGGYMIIHSGLLANSISPDEVAGVLAHELAHVELRHGIRQLIRAVGIMYMTSMVFGAGFEGFDGLELAQTTSEIGTALVLLKYSREMESEADEYSFNLLSKKNYDPSGLIDFFKRMRNIEIVEESVKKESKNLNDEKLNKAINYFSTHPSTKKRIKMLEAMKIQGHIYKKLPVSSYRWRSIKRLCN